MQIPQIEYFLSVAKFGSVRKASERLRISASAISRQIQLLEHMFETELFDRSQKGMILTEEGQALEEHFRRISRELELGRAEINNIKGLITGCVRFAVIEGVARSWLFPAIEDFRKKYPGVSFDGKIIGAESVVQAVSSAHSDFGITIEPEISSDFEVICDFPTRFIAALPSNHFLANKQVIHLSDLVKCDLALLDRSFLSRLHLIRSGHKQGFSFEPVLELNHIELVTSFIANSNCVSVLPDYAVSPDARKRGIITLPIDESELPAVTTKLFTHKERRTTLSCKEFFKTLIARTPS